MIRILAFLLALVPAACLAQPGQSVRQNSNVSPRHPVCWTTSGVIQDAMPGGDPCINILGIEAIGPAVPFTIDSNVVGGPYSQLSVGYNSSDWQISLNAFGGDAHIPLQLCVNGNCAITINDTTVTIPSLTVPLPTIPNGQVIGNISGITFPATGVPISLLTTGLNVFTTSQRGVAPPSGGGTTNFLRADGTWTSPAGAGTVSSVTAGACLTTTQGASGSPITGTGTLYGYEPSNAEVGATYTFVDSDQCKLVRFTDLANSVAVTLPQAGSGGLFLSGWSADVENNTNGFVTIAPAAGDINNGTSVSIGPGQGGKIVSDGVNYQFLPGSAWASVMPGFIIPPGTIQSGFQVDNRGNIGAEIFSGVNIGGSSIQPGTSQIEDYVFANSTSGASAVRLTTDGKSANGTNVAAINGGQIVSFTAECTITDNELGTARTYSLAQSILGRTIGSGGSTVLVANGGGVVAGPVFESPAALQAAPTFVADTSLKGLNISYTPPSANTDLYQAVCHVHYLTVGS